MFRRDPVKAALAEVSGLLGHDARPLTPLARAVFRRGGVLGVARGTARAVLALGDVPPAGVFELASVSKPFTAALAAALVAQGRIAWDRPLARLGGPLRGLPATLTPRALATHTAGLPMHPARVMVTTFTHFYDPYGPLSERAVLGSARRWARRPEARGGPAFAYSNLGMGVLALALAYAADQEVSAAGYGQALAQWVTRPLGLGVTLRAAVPEVVTPSGVLGGHDLTGFGPLTGAGGLFGSAADLLTFAQAHQDTRAGQHWQQVQRPPGLPAHVTGVAPGWFESGGARWHDGVARGTRTALGFHPDSGAVVTILARGGVPVVGQRGAVPALLLALLNPAPQHS